MGGLFDRLQNQIENRDKDAGISPLDLATLPLPMRRIMRTMLREVEMTHSELVQVMAAMPEADRLSQAELEESLSKLAQEGWLIRLGVDELVTYKVNLRRKAGSTLAQGIWSALDSKMEKKTSEESESGSETDPTGAGAT
jgi:hypothetical protein